MSLQVNIKKRWKGFTLGLSFCSDGAPLGILGASGSGKSMALKCLAGLITPDEGEISLNGRILYSSAQNINLKPQQRGIGYLFQSYALFPHMTVAQNIQCVLSGPRPAQQAETEKLLAAYQLEGLAQRYPSQLSGGQQQRVALARILASRPAALLLDEPFSALDEHLKDTLQLEMMALLQQYQGDAIMVTHNRDEAFRLSQNLLFLHEGQALLYGDTKACFQNPKKLLAARLTGCKNFSRARAAGPSLVHAVDWNCTLKVHGPLPAGLSHIGVRAHFFHPATKTEDNSLPVQHLQTVENPFEWNLLFHCQKRTAASHGVALPLEVASPESRLWWKCPKTGPAPPLPEALSVFPEDVLLLTE